MNAAYRYADLEHHDIASNRDAVHAYARILGDLLKTCRDRRRYWWHASLRPSLHGLGTGIVHATVDFELVLNLRDSVLEGGTRNGERLVIDLRGQPAAEVAVIVRQFLVDAGMDDSLIPDLTGDKRDHPDYSKECVADMATTLNAVSADLARLRAIIPEETSPIQVWPHHFDLSMLWLPGEKIPGQDHADEESSDKQINFGFAFGDGGIPEPYFYITAYPTPEALPAVALPAGTDWLTENFNGPLPGADENR